MQFNFDFFFFFLHIFDILYISLPEREIYSGPQLIDGQEPNLNLGAAQLSTNGPRPDSHVVIEAAVNFTRR